MDLELTVTFAGILVAGVAGVLGVWMERDREAPQRWAWVFSSLIVVAVGIEMVHSVAAEAEDSATEERMATVLEQLAQISEGSDNPALKSFVGSELAAQARNNPSVMDKVGAKIAASGGDPTRLRRQAAVGRRTAAGLPPRSLGLAAHARSQQAGIEGCLRPIVVQLVADADQFCLPVSVLLMPELLDVFLKTFGPHLAVQ